MKVLKVVHGFLFLLCSCLYSMPEKFRILYDNFDGKTYPTYEQLECLAYRSFSLDAFNGNFDAYEKYEILSTYRILKYLDPSKPYYEGQKFEMSVAFIQNKNRIKNKINQLHEDWWENLKLTMQKKFGEYPNLDKLFQYYEKNGCFPEESEDICDG